MFIYLSVGSAEYVSRQVQYLYVLLSWCYVFSYQVQDRSYNELYMYGWETDIEP